MQGSGNMQEEVCIAAMLHSVNIGWATAMNQILGYVLVTIVSIMQSLP